MHDQVGISIVLYKNNKTEVLNVYQIYKGKSINEYNQI